MLHFNTRPPTNKVKCAWLLLFWKENGIVSDNLLPTQNMANINKLFRSGFRGMCYGWLGSLTKSHQVSENWWSQDSEKLSNLLRVMQLVNVKSPDQNLTVRFQSLHSLWTNTRQFVLDFGVHLTILQKKEIYLHNSVLPWLIFFLPWLIFKLSLPSPVTAVWWWHW